MTKLFLCDTIYFTAVFLETFPLLTFLGHNFQLQIWSKTLEVWKWYLDDTTKQCKVNGLLKQRELHNTCLTFLIKFTAGYIYKNYINFLKIFYFTKNITYQLISHFLKTVTQA